MNKLKHLITSKNMVPIEDFSIVALYVDKTKNHLFRKNLTDEWYFFNDMYIVNEYGVLVKNTNHKTDFDGFYGHNIRITAVAGKNGSGKSSVFEMLCRIINNISCVLVRGEGSTRRKMHDMYFIQDLWAKLYFTVGSRLYCFSCEGNQIRFLKDNLDIKIIDVEDKSKKRNILMTDFVQWSKELLFYTIITNYSTQSYNRFDYSQERAIRLIQHQSDQRKEGNWIDAIYDKNDGYMVPLALNPYRSKDGINIYGEFELLKYRLSSIFIWSSLVGYQFLDNYSLNEVRYTFNREKVIKCYKNARITIQSMKDALFSTRAHTGIVPRLSNYFMEISNISADNDDILLISMLYIIWKLHKIIKNYPNFVAVTGVTSFSAFVNTLKNPQWPEDLQIALKQIVKDNSHITMKLKKALLFIKLYQTGYIKKELILRPDGFSHNDYLKACNSIEKPRTIQHGYIYLKWLINHLPPSFFDISLYVNKIEKSSSSKEDYHIPISRMSAGELQYVNTFSTYIYHILNMLSVARRSDRVRYRRFNMIFDEVELCFHPEYQRCFIAKLLGFIERLELNQVAAFNIIIATHSPFILSDIPARNILYLEDGKSTKEVIEDTFCANICDILHQSFFLHNGFQGEYVRVKLQRILNALLQGKNPRVRNYKAIVEQIRDPFVKMHFEQLMKEEHETSIDQ